MDQTNLDVNRYSGFIYSFIRQYIELPEEEFQKFLPLLEVRVFGKKEIVLRYGQTDDYLNLIVTGLVRKYVLAGKNDITLQLATEGHLIQSEVSFHTRVPSTVMLETIEPTVLISMGYNNVHYALDTIPVTEKIGREMITSMFLKKDAHYFSQLNHTTRERFLMYLKQHPLMLQRVPQKILASYLDIKPETFSRLKHLLKK